MDVSKGILSDIDDTGHAVMTQVVPKNPYRDGWLVGVLRCEEGGVYWPGLTREQWERLRPYEGQELPVNRILAIANAPQESGR